MADANNGPPPIEALQTGDLLFPRPVDGWVPYLTGHANQSSTYGEEEKEWLELRQQIVDGKGVMPPAARAKIGTMSYDEFRAHYGGTGNPALFGVHFYTGHVAIFDSGEVIEALWDQYDSVIKHSYADWVKVRGKDLVWQSRLTGKRDADLRKFCDAARAQVGKPYDFINFNLLDATGFYCSKLVWFAAKTALGLALDDHNNPERIFWYSPKQLLHSKHLTAIQAPDNY